MLTMNGVTAFVLAGGRSSRMGADKAFLQLDGSTLLARAIRTASVVGPVRLVGNPSKFTEYGDVIADLFHAQGPLAGIQAALRSTNTRLNLVLAVDMPFVTAEFLQVLLRRAQDSDRMVTVPRAGGRLQPLCGIYRQDFADVAEPALREGRNKIDPLFTSDQTCVIDESELVALAFSPSMFDNLNTAEEFEKARSAMRETK
jgi:molybdopterin-guanine dinucleotide biosynthesis protein A